MTTSEFSNPKRWQPRKYPASGGEGLFYAGVHVQDFKIVLADIFSTWAHYEESMISVLEKLIFVEKDVLRISSENARGHSPARQIFRGIGANGVRSKVMNHLLKSYIGNHSKPEVYDSTISLFQTLTNKRNDYYHGLWWTKSDDTIWLQVENVHELSFMDRRIIEIRELQDFLESTEILSENIERINIDYFDLKSG